MDEVALNVVEVIADHPLFAGCSARELDDMARLGTALAVEPGYVLTREGRRGYEFFLIVEGTASCVSGGVEITTLGPGDVFGEMGLADVAPRTATVTASSPMRLIAVDARELNAAAAIGSSGNRTCMATLAESLRAAQRAED